MTDFELDVRPLLRDGGEPFGAIMAAVNQLQAGQCLRLYVTFKPEPLFNVMASKGFNHEATPLDDGDWVVTFTPEKGNDAPLLSAATSPETWPDPAAYLDCTELDPPEPMVQILAALEVMTEGTVLFALVGREPIFLFPELQLRGHAWAGDVDETGAVYRLMIRVGAKS